MVDIARPASREEVPVLDLSPLQTGAPLGLLARQLDEACRSTGFFYVARHGIPQATIDGVFAATRRYFSLPYEERLQHRMDERFRRGFMPQGINQHKGFVADLKESYEVGVDLPLDHPSVRANLPLHGPNRWPAEHPWLKQAVEAYFAETTALGLRLLRVIAAALDLPDAFFLDLCRNPMVQLRLFHYPPQPPLSPENAFGVAPHTDYGMITLLAQDPIGGLELRKRDGEWIAAPFIPGTLVVNIGDLFQRWSNDRYVSNPHRVINRTGRERYSIPTFFNMDYDAVVSCLPSCCDETSPPRHPPIASGDYLVSRFQAVQKYQLPAMS